MKHYLRLFFLFLITIPGLCFASIATDIHAIIGKTLGARAASSHIGIVIQSMKTGRVLYRRNSEHLFTPASVQKTLTAVAALHYLKPSFTFNTKLLVQGAVKKKILKGDVYFKFSGDPNFTDADLQSLIDVLHKKGIKKIMGHVYIDASGYGNVPYPPGWLWDDLSYSFAAPLRMIIINHNYFTLTLKKKLKSMRRPSIHTELPDGVVRFVNALRVVKKLPSSCPIRIYSDDLNRYQLRGCYYQYWRQQVRKVAIRDMSRYARVLLRQALQDSQVVYHNKINFRTAPKNARLLAQHVSFPLHRIIKKMLKDSDNLMTNAVLKKLGERYFHRQGTWQNSLKALKIILAKPTGINFHHNLINDGAGLSRYNLISPRQLARLLYFAYHNKTVKKAFIAALPIAGKDGTLAHRLRDQRRGGRIHLKTGSMTGVSALAGYIKTKKHGMVSFVILINGFVKPKVPYIQLENNICRYLVSDRYHG